MYTKQNKILKSFLRENKLKTMLCGKNMFNSDVNGIVEVMRDSFKELRLGLKPNIVLGLCI